MDKSNIQSSPPVEATYPVDVGSYEKNPFGLYDMNGNVWEICHDWLGDYTSEHQINPTGPETGTDHVLRGGSWHEPAIRSAYRYYCWPEIRATNVGFRVVHRVFHQSY
jgi:formylglycine-generating enzyme required for sulfatase activity